MQLDGLGQVCLAIAVLVIRRGDNCDLVQIVLKAGKQPAHTAECGLSLPQVRRSEQYTHVSVFKMFTTRGSADMRAQEDMPVQLARRCIDTCREGVLLDRCLENL